MRCVIYANDMEPLTIVELSEFAGSLFVEAWSSYFGSAYISCT